MPTFREMVEAARPHVREVSAIEAKQIAEAHEDVVLLDVREDHEWAMGHLPGAILVPLRQLDLQADSGGPRPNADLTAATERPVVAYCATGARSILAADLLQKLGYRDVVSMRGGIMGWAREGLPID